MQAFILTCVASVALATAAVAQTEKTTPGNAPTQTMDKATPEMKGTGIGQPPIALDVRRASEQKALHLVAILGLEKVELCDGLDIFREWPAPQNDTRI